MVLHRLRHLDLQRVVRCRLPIEEYCSVTVPNSGKGTCSKYCWIVGAFNVVDSGILPASGFATFAFIIVWYASSCA